jgi:hypothetical protein
MLRGVFRFVGLGLVAGAVLHGPLGAQVKDSTKVRRDTTLTAPVPQRADSLLRDSLAKRDSLRARKPVPRDTIKAALAHAELPALPDVGRRLYWTRDSLFATGALTVADLLERVAGVTTLHAGWISAPAVGSYLGNVHGVRVFYDGVELPVLDPRSGGAFDLTHINLWSAEDVAIEQAPEEVRVYIRSWRVRNTNPLTRTDVSTGDQQTNLYRGFFGKRLDNGAAVQFGAQQYGTTPPSAFGLSSDQLGIIGRVGWARNDWSVDGYITRVSRHRGTIYGVDPADSLSGIESARSDSYLRVGYGDPDASPLWGQVMAVASKYDYTGIRTAPTFGLTTAAESLAATASLDTSRFRSQYIATVGTVRGPLRLSATQRFIGGGGKTFAVPSVRGSFATPLLTVSGLLEGKSFDSTSRLDATGEFAPLSFVSLLAGVGRVSDDRVADNSFSATYERAQVGLRLRNLWLLGGVMRRDSVRSSAPTVFNPTRLLCTVAQAKLNPSCADDPRSLVPRGDPSATGITAGIRGQVWRLLHADVSAIKWNDSLGYYRPRYQTRSELFLRTNLLQRFPTGDFGLLASAVHEYRSGVRFPVGTDGVLTVPGYRTISTLVEIRVLSATISWQFRNVLGERYSQVPTFIMPRQTNFYGVRWEFID